MSHDAAMGANPEADRHDDSSDQRLPSISILMPTKDRIEELLETLDSITGQEHPPEEVVIIDQSAEDCELLVATLYPFDRVCNEIKSSDQSKNCFQFLTIIGCCYDRP